MTGETSTFRANGQADATAQYLDVVASNLLVWTDPERDAHCDECGAATDELVGLQHGPACSLHPDNCVDAQAGRQTVSDHPSGYVTVEDTCWPDPTDPRELGWRLR